MAEKFLPPVFQSAVQTLLPSRFSEGRFGNPFPERRLANALRRLPHGLVGGSGELAVSGLTSADMEEKDYAGNACNSR